jgi:FtsP/CotA-like multicopper oxidase with cupredoxin domain
MISRRDLLHLFALSAAVPAPRGVAQTQGAADHRLVIAPATWELSPRHTIETTTYNGQVPGPLLRFQEGRPVSIEVSNQTNRPEVVHWHGLHIPSAVDGAMEEGTPPISPGSSARYTFTPRPSGFRWYHTHTMAMNDLTVAQYGGQHGFLLIEPRDNPAPYDREFFVGLHDWNGRLQGSGDGAMNPVYPISTINGRTLGFGEPLRVKQGERVMLHVLNSSPTEVHWLSFAGHDLRVVALDGNPVPNPRVVPMLRLAPAERVCALVEMKNPGVWILGEVRKHVQAAGMGIVVEYSDRAGPPQWRQPPTLEWNYADFAPEHSPGPRAESVITVPLVIESKFRGHGNMESWALNGRSYPDAGVEALQEGRRYRLQFINRSMDDHPLHLHRHSFELRTLDAPLMNGQTAADERGAAGDMGGGVAKDVVLVGAQSCTEVEFTANNPGKTLLHCHQQNHMDLGFMMLLDYA